MKKSILFFFVSMSVSTAIFSQISSAEISDYSEQQERQVMAEVADIVNYMQSRVDVVYSVSGTTVNDQCVAFLDRNLNLGSVGKYISTELQTHHANYNELLDARSMKATCNQYTKLSLKDKSMVWTAVMVLMAHFESSCNNKVTAKGPNGTASGYYQLHHNKEDQYDGSENTCLRGISTDPLKSSKCVLGMLNLQMIRHNGELFSNRSYWDVLRPNGAAKKAGVIKNTIQRMSLCQPAKAI